MFCFLDLLWFVSLTFFPPTCFGEFCLSCVLCYFFNLVLDNVDENYSDYIIQNLMYLLLPLAGS